MSPGAGRPRLERWAGGVRQLRVQLVLLVLCALLPALGMSFQTGLRQRRERVEQARIEAGVMAQAVARLHHGLIEGSRRMLLTLSWSQDFLDFEVPAVEAVLTRLCQEHGIYATILLADAAGCYRAAAVPLSDGLSIADRPYFQRALAQRVFQIGGYAVSRSTGIPVIHLAMPLTPREADAPPPGVVVVALELSALARLPEGIAMVPGGEVRVLDRSGHVLHHTATGEPADSGWGDVPLAPMQAPGPAEGSFQDTAPDGREWLHAYVRLDLTPSGGDMYVVVTVPMRAVTVPADAQLAQQIGVLLLVGGATMGLALFIGRRLILDRAHTLMAAASRLSEGDLSVRSGLGGEPGEFGELARAFDQMADTLQRRARQRAETEAALRLSEERLALALEGAGEGLWDWHLPSGRAFFSPRYYTMLGYAPGDFPASLDSWRERVHPDDLEPVLARVRDRLSAGHKDYIIDFRMRTQDGAWRWIQGRGQVVEQDEGGNPVRMVGVHTDITERRLAEEALRASERRFQTLFQNMAEGVALNRLVRDEVGRGVDYRILDVNPAYVRVTGLSREAVVGRLGSEAYQVVPPPLLDDFTRVVETGESFRLERFYKAIGAHLDTSVAFTGDEGFASIFTDITQRKAAEAERERLMGELAHKNRELEEIIYVASHDLRSPLVNVQGFSQRLERLVREVTGRLTRPGVPDDIRADVLPLLRDRAMGALRYITVGAQRMDALINGLLRLSRIGRQPIVPVRVDMNRMVAATLNAMAFQIDQVGATVDTSDLPAAVGDAAQISQVWANLLDNAVKYRSPDRPLRIVVSGRMTDDAAEYEIQDTGVGIDPMHQARIWDIFHRLSPQGVAGEGLGLTLARRIVERHGGTISVESEPDRGSRFVFRLPTEPPSADPLPPVGGVM